jgi:hypothetical protein
MKTSTFEKGIPMLPRACALVLLFFAPLPLAAGCIGGFTNDGVTEGNRCNPLSSHNECSSGLVCAGNAMSSVAIPFCPENYCCSVDSNGNIHSNDPNCQPGCNGGAGSICTATMDPGACAFADGSSLQAAMALEDAGIMSTGAAEGGD